MQQATVAAGLVSGLLDYAQRRGADPNTLSAHAGVSRDELLDPDARIPLPRYLSLMRRAQLVLDDGALALHYGAEVAMADVSIVGLIMEAAPDMAEALRQMQRYGRLALEIDTGMPGPRFELERAASGLLLVESHPVGPEPEFIEEAFARLVCGPRRFLNEPHVLAVEIAHPKPAHYAEYERVFECPVRFGARRNALALHPDVASWQVARHPRYVFGVLLEKGDALLAARPSAHRYRERVEHILRAVLHEGDLGAGAVAERLGCSRSTLFRRLRDEGTSYRQVVDGVRQDLAMAYLRAGRASVSEVAYLVGFSDAASFSRTFRRWTGSSPGRFRRTEVGPTGLEPMTSTV